MVGRDRAFDARLARRPGHDAQPYTFRVIGLPCLH
jgi:hypothetical protein